MSEGRRGTHRLGRALVSEIGKRSKRLPSHDLATVNANLGLELDMFGIPIPAGDYIIEETFLKNTLTRAGGAGDPAFESHDHKLRAALKTGDRVIVLIIDADSDSPTFIVTGRI